MLRGLIIQPVARAAKPYVQRLLPRVVDLGLALASGDEGRIKRARVDLEVAVDGIAMRRIRGEL